MLRIVGIGGGTGLPTLLRGLALLQESEADELCVTGIVCVSDNGGSSGRLREDFALPAMGDARNCLVALASRSSLLGRLFGYRFSGANANGLGGHALGNLILTALCQETGSLQRAIDLAGESMDLCGSVLPVTESAVTLCAMGQDGRFARGEREIVSARLQIDRVWLEPEVVPPSRGVLEALEAADAIVLGPGSLYTSVLPPLLVAGVADAIRRSAAVRIYVCNLMVEPGETDNFSASDHLRALEPYLGPDAIDVCVLNTRRAAGRLMKKYLAVGAAAVRPDPEEVQALGVAPLAAELLAEEAAKARHDPLLLGRVVLDLARTRVALRRTYVSLGTKVGKVCVESSAT